MSDEKLPSSDPKILSGRSVFVPAVPCLKHNGTIHDESLELYEDSIVDPNESEPDCGLVDSSDSDDDMVPGPGRQCAWANAMSDDYDHGLADDDDHNIIIHYDSDTDYGPCDEFEGLEFETTGGSTIDDQGSQTTAQTIERPQISFPHQAPKLQRR